MSLRKITLIASLLALPLFGYLFWHVSTPSTLTDTLSPYQKAGEQVKESLASLPTLPIREEDTKYTIEDTLTEGIEITYPNQTNQEESREEMKSSLTLRFPKKYASEPMEVQIAEGKTILIQDKNVTGDYTSESLSLGGDVPPLLSKEGAGGGNPLSWLQSLLRGSTSESENQYLSYTDPSKRITTYYAYGHDQATGEKQLKNWQIYNNPSVIKGESVAYSFTNAKLKKNEDGSIGVYYYGEQEIQNEKVLAEVDPSLMERAQRTLAKEMGDSINSGETPANFTIPKPYYINVSGDRIDLDWRLSMDGKDISIDFAPEANEYPLALDPTLSFTVPAMSNTGDVITGEITGNFFGYSAMTSGDFNADGKTDIAIGAYKYNTNQGRTYIFYSDGTLPTNAATADVVITGESGSGYFGSALNVGDFNADGKDDLSVGAYLYNGNNQGRAYVFYGGSMASENASGADVILTGETGDNHFGVSLATGDFNADGRDDLSVGAREYDANYTGRVYIFYGGSIISENASGADVILTGETNGVHFGASVISGDFNADGKDDLAVGSTYWTSSTGRTYIFYGGSMASENASGADVILTGGGTYEYFGSSLVTGDFNVDGKDDIAVGAFGYSGERGRAFIFYGGSMVSETTSGADITLTGETASNYFGITLTAGDFNADGRTDIVVGAMGYSSSTGRTYIFYNDGSIPATAATADVIITGEATSNFFGHSFASGDFNADGKTDLAVGAYGHASSKGRAYIFYSQNGQVNTNQNITGNATSDQFGGAMITGDFNADGRIDLAVGATGYNPGGVANTGRVYIFYGDGQIPTTAATADVTITGNASGYYFGSAFAVADLNADGKSDLVVGAPNSSGASAVYVFYNDGSIPTTAATADIIITGSTGNFGASMATGDLDASGTTDLIIGAYGYSSYTGRAFIFYNDGSLPTADSSADVTITGESTSTRFGWAFATGDFNADGRIDLAVDAEQYSSFAGRAYIFYNDGSIPTAAATADVAITGTSANDTFGYAMTAGDFNADGKTDLVVGAPNSTSNSKVSIFYADGTNNFGTVACSGSAPTTCNASDADTIILHSGSYLGRTLAVGDMNADGIDDLIAGTGSNTNVYIFYNDSSIPTTAANADVIVTGVSGFGYALAVGDWNNDGRKDLVVGSPAESTNTGAVYLYETRENFAWKLQSIPSNTGGLRTGLSGTGEEMKITGGAASDLFGYAMTTGDFNADGKTDLAVGSYGYSTSTGRVYIFYGDGSLSSSTTSADVVISGEATNNYFGYALSAGDLNADGKMDLAVGAYLYSSYYGRAYIFYNDNAYPSLASGADVKIGGTYSHNNVGSSLATGDFNTDGKVDLAIGAAALSSSGTTTHAYILYNDGSYPSDISGADVEISSEGLSEKFGVVMVSGDFNTDGRTDLAVAANGYAAATGRAYIFYNDIGGIPSTAASADAIIQGTGSGSYFGSSMAAGDFNADGKTDIVIGATHTSGNSGAHIFYNDGSSFGTVACTTDCLAANADIIIQFGSPNSYFGTVSSGDFNGDGRTDLVVGAYGYSTNTGRAYIFYNDGNFGTVACTTGCLATNADVILTGEATSNYFGSSFISGDFNADGKTDLVVGAYGYSTNTGRVYLYTFNDPVITGEATSNAFGSSFTSGDFNADGRIDLAVGASGYSTNTGRVYVFYNDGSIPNLASSADVIITGEATNNYFGASLESGDFNADGKTDLATVSYGYSSNNGRAYIFYNGSITTESASGADVIISGSSGNRFGESLVSGDLNADGRTDLAVGNTGRNVYIFYNDGSYPTTDGTADVNIDDGGATGNKFGSSLATGDFNDDGRVDLAIGSSYYFNYANTGRVYIFYNDIGGMPTTSASADVTIDGEGGYFGGVLLVGDFNADGKIDLASSARSYNSSGRVYIFYTDGAPYPASVASADVIIDGASGTSYFGTGLAAGDLNADGRTDLVVGDTRAGGSFVGRAFVFYNDGSYPATTTNADAVMNGGVANDYFSSAMTTGDFNADGKADLAVGAYGYSTNTGRVYLFTSEAAVKSVPDPVRTRGTVKLRGTSKLR